VTDLVDDSRPDAAQLVGLPEQSHLPGKVFGDCIDARGCYERIVELVQQAADAQMRGENRPARRFGGMSGQHEPEGHGFRPAIAEPVERVAEGVAWNSSLELVLAPTPQPVVLLCDVDELEVEREGADHGLLFVQLETANGLAESIARGTFTRLP
jgi:hypothetical protein